MRIFKLARHMKYSKVLYFGISFLFFSIYANALFTSANTRPTADAGADRTFNVGEEIRLQGSGTDLDKDPLTFAWAIVFKPAGSKTILPNNNIPNPSFIPDLEGDYMFNLKVNDGQVNSLPDTVLFTTKTLSPENNKPTADAGADRTVNAGEDVELQGLGLDLDKDTITFKWLILSKPENSKASLSNQTAQNPKFTPDIAGFYAVQLVTNDGKENSEPDAVIISVAESSGECIDGTCDLNAKQLCKSGMFISEGYCEYCGNKDKSCLGRIGSSCAYDLDCDSEFCFRNKCAEPTCDDTALNGDESDIDCGGGCKNKCKKGQDCSIDEDCEYGLVCVSQICTETKPGKGAIPDSDKDGIPDEWESEHGLDTYDPSDAELDFDKDGLANLQEYTFRTNPRNADSDRDGMSDKEEVEKGTNPLGQASKPGGVIGTLFLIVILIIVFGAGTYGFYYFKDYFIKPKAKTPSVCIAPRRTARRLLSPEEKIKTEQVVKKRRKIKKEKREEFFEGFFNSKSK